MTAIEKVRSLTKKELIDLDYEEYVALIKGLSFEENLELSEKVGYPVHTRKCMGDLRHDFVLLQDGVAVIIVNSEGHILLQSRADRDMWGVPGGCQEAGERFEEVAIREIKEETNLDVREEDLELLAVVSGLSRRNSYPNRDNVINNTILYLVRNYSGELKWDEESKEMAFFDLDNLPENQNDPDLINIYKRTLKRK